VSHPDSGEHAHRLALAVLTMRANTPEGHWLQGDDEDAYMAIWREAENLYGDQADEDMFLAAINLGSLAVQLLADAQGVPASAVLQGIATAQEQEFGS
jgi:hypothetical protein